MTLLEAAELYMMAEGITAFADGRKLNTDLLQEIQNAMPDYETEGWGLFGLWLDLVTVWLEAHDHDD